MVDVFFANGFEEIEALTVVDMLRRASIDVQMVSTADTLEVTSSHKVTVKCDVMLEQAKNEEADMLVLPGGIPGMPNLKENPDVIEMLKKQYEDKKWLAAICASPSIFASLGFLKGKKAISYPDYEDELRENGAEVVRESVVVTDHIITSRGMGTTILFAAEIIKQLKDVDTANDVLRKIIYNDTI